MKRKSKKITVLMASAAIGTSLVTGPFSSKVLAESNTSTVNYTYVTMSELTDSEKTLIQEGVPDDVIKSDADYLLVYRPTSTNASLPGLGSDGTMLLTAGGAALLVVAVSLVGKNRRSKILSSSLIVVVGTSIVTVPVSAYQNSILSTYNQTLTVSTGQSNRPQVDQIEGYIYVGFIVLNQQNSSISGAQENDLMTDGLAQTTSPSLESSLSASSETTTDEENSSETIINVSDNLDSSTQTVTERSKTESETSLSEFQDTQNDAASETSTSEKITDTVTSNVQMTLTLTSETPQDENKAYLSENVASETTSTTSEVISQSSESVSEGIVSSDVNSELTSTATTSEVISSETATSTSETATVMTIAQVTETTTIAYGITYVEDDTLEAGQEVVSTEGQDGQVVVVYTVTYDNGVESNRVESSRETTEAVNKVIRVGTKQSSIITSTVEERTTIAAGTDYIEDNTLSLGTTEVRTVGQDGEIVSTYEVTTADGVEISRKLLSQVTVDAVNTVIAVGTAVTAEAVTTTNTVTEVLPYETEYVASDELSKGQTQVVQEGVDGSRTVTTTTTTVGDAVITVDTEEEVVAAVKEIIAYGTSPVVTHSTYVETVTLAYTTERKESSTLAEGVEQVIQSGQGGSTTYTYDITYEDGVEVSRELVSTDTTEAVPEIIYVGTGIITTATATVSEEVAYNSKNVETITLPVGTTKVTTEGVNGSVTYTYEVTYKDGVELSRTLVAMVTVDAVDEVVSVGTGTAITFLYENSSGQVAVLSGYNSSGQVTFVWEDLDENYPLTYEAVAALTTDERAALQKVLVDIQDSDYQVVNSLLDTDLLRETFLNLVNDARAESGLDALEYSDTLNNYAMIRATEMAEYGSIRYNNKKHTRTDGTSYTTVFSTKEFAYASIVGENILSRSSKIHIIGDYFDVVAIATADFEQFKASARHWSNLMSVNYSYIGYATYWANDTLNSATSDIIVSENLFSAKNIDDLTS